MNTEVPNLLPRLDFNITNRCNFRCIHCGFRSGPPSEDEFKLKKISEVFRDFMTIGGEQIDITGGEALMRDDVGEIIKIGKGLGLKIKLVTNGSLLTDKKLEYFKDLGLDAIAISLDGSTYETYQKIRPVAKTVYETVVTNIRKCVKYGFSVKINIVVFRSNLEDLKNIIELCIKWSIKECRFCYFTPVGRGLAHSDEVVSPEKWLKFIRTELIKYKDKIKISVGVPFADNNLLKQDNLPVSCYLKNPTYLQILSDGNVYPCAIMASYNKPCGNLYKKTLSQIWHDRKLWNGSYFENNVAPCFKKFGGCVDYGKSFKNIVDSDKYKFVCLMCKFKVDDLCHAIKNK